ncbi:hypothetical protein FZEAL_4037 [Fusarium zealandicum]|uniref:AMP-activated protein kinase glycogen-binding domain-containing protein n=1 Tax=Fusarium zealandicum TaxID=1053134 RepID=A0A8H4UND5_9HYPO|nr:hypothetical protein FZEAL_4037 [Fusarium zealandicum]
MGSFTFKWEHPADEVYVTGTFDNWTKSVKLDKNGSVFSKTVDLKDTSDKIYYKVRQRLEPPASCYATRLLLLPRFSFYIAPDSAKSQTPFLASAEHDSRAPLPNLPDMFVVDGNWITNHSEPSEPDSEGNVNNFLAPEHITKDTPSAAILNTVTPSSTTATMASQQPIETKPTEAKSLEDKLADEKIAEDKAADSLAAKQPEEDSAMPLETPSDVPGGFPITPANELEKHFGVNPLPASEGVGNPISLEPGEKIPESITAQSTDKYVKLDKESYEKSDAHPGVETDIPQLPPFTPNTIPESSLPILGFQDSTINSAAPTSTTAALAADVPLESNGSAVPEVVKESQEKANAAPEASAEAEEVREKAKVEEELKDKVPEAPATSVGTSGFGTEKSEKSSDAGLAALAATAGGAFIAAGLTAKGVIEENAGPAINNATDAITDTANKTLPDAVKEQLPVAAQEAMDTKNKEQIREEVSPEVPAEVKDSLVEAGKAPEAAANTAAVEDKKEVEAELLREVKPITGTYDAVVESSYEENKQVSPEVPIEVKESIVEAGKNPEAAANTEAVEEKKLVEAELLKEVKPAAAVEETQAETVAPTVPDEVKESIVESGKGPEAATSTEAVENKREVETQLLKETHHVPAVGETTTETVAPEVPAEVKDSIIESGKGPEAATSTDAVEKKSEVEAQLLKEAQPVPAVGETKTEEVKPATQPEETKTKEPETVIPTVVEPQKETKTEAPKTETPAVGNGTSASENGSKPAESTANGGSSANGSTSTGAQKKKHNRLSSIFSKIKNKLSDNK